MRNGRACVYYFRYERSISSTIVSSMDHLFRVHVHVATEGELKRRTGEFDLEAITFLDLSDEGSAEQLLRKDIVLRNLL